ncbi:MAG: flavodoxin family protein [Bacillota bacterium]|nr:flavodoxin family protein [Bacillota bacterium]
MKKILIISGGHRTFTAGDGTQFRSNSSAVVRRLLEHLPEERVELIDINTLKIEHCIDCTYCSNSWGACIFDDDMTQIYRLLSEADIYVFVTPVYFNAVPSRLKVLIDRLQMVYKSKYVHGIPFPEDKPRRGYLVTFGGARGYSDQFTGVESTIRLVLSNFGAKLDDSYCYPATDHRHLENHPDLDRDMTALLRDLLRDSE